MHSFRRGYDHVPTERWKYVVYSTRGSRYSSDHRDLFRAKSLEAAIVMVNYLNGGSDMPPDLSEYEEVK